MTAVRTRVDGAVGWAVLDRPQQLNAVTLDLADQLGEAVTDLATQCRVVAIRGEGGNFCAGGDFREVERLRLEGADALRSLFDAFARSCDAFAAVDVPVVAVVEGFAMAGGFEFAQACDIVLARDDAVFCDSHVTHGQVPGGGGSQRLPRLVGRQRALAHMLTGERLSGIEAVQWGLAYRSWPAEDFDAEVAAFLDRLASHDPVALARIKRLIRDGLAMPLEVGLQHERDTIVQHLLAGDGATGAQRFLDERSSRDHADR
jgi:enoyl-CoA hydratase/carnithine racemase